MIQSVQRANALRVLSIDMVEQANSGHPGAPMGMADAMEVLWHNHLTHNPKNPQWANRDRFVLSNGHSCALWYASLHLSGYALSIQDLRQFRQFESKTPGHPEYAHTPGVESTTGPLGQGLAHAVGMAMAEAMLAEQFNRPDQQIIDHYTYVFVGDGCLMEGISHEVCSLAGTLGLGKLIVLYDSNQISIDGSTSLSFTENTAMRFKAYGWHVIEDIDGHDAQSIDRALTSAKANQTQPSILQLNTCIGFGSPACAGTAKVHGAPLGAIEVSAVRQSLNWPWPAFEIPEGIQSSWDASAAGVEREQHWLTHMQHYQRDYPEAYAELNRRLSGQLPPEFTAYAQSFIQAQHEAQKSIATRAASQQAIAHFSEQLPELFGGSADLSSSNLTQCASSVGIAAGRYAGNYCFYGVREFGMSAIMSGISLHAGFRPYAGTFLVFSDYARNAIRLAALMKQPTIFVYTHDSIGLGQDGPTHQPIEQLTHLRSTPNLMTWRPADAVETAVAWHMAIERKDGPTALVFSRQTLPHQTRTQDQCSEIYMGAYILRATHQTPRVILIATGSEVGLSMKAAQSYDPEQAIVQVVSMPCAERFAQQSDAYQASVLPPGIPRIAIEAAHPDYWQKWIGHQGTVLGLDHFGASAPAETLFQAYQLTEAAVISQIQRYIVITN